MLRYFTAIGFLLLGGCALLPEVSQQPQLHNPFPQLSKVAVAPFFNQSHELTLDGRQVAIAYFNELQAVPGFEVVPVGVVETVINEQGIQLRGPADARRLARLLKVDALIVGAITDYSPYYPPRMALQVEWYTANSGFHPIPPGYGLPWGTAAEKEIPAPLIFEAEMALAKAQLKTQTPRQPATPISDESPGAHAAERSDTPSGQQSVPDSDATLPGGTPSPSGMRSLQYEVPLDVTATSGTPLPIGTGFPPDWPDPQGFIPPGPRPTRPPYRPSKAPVLRHVRTYNGNDMEFTTALSGYYSFRDEARSGGWQSYLQRSDDFIRFCCHMHVSEMLSARGGAGQSRVVWRWPSIR